MFLVIVLLVSFFAATSSSDICSVCTCDNLFVDCTNQNLYEVPDISKSVEKLNGVYIDFRHNNLKAHSLKSFLQEHDHLSWTVDIRNNGCFDNNFDNFLTKVIFTTCGTTTYERPQDDQKSTTQENTVKKPETTPDKPGESTVFFFLCQEQFRLW